MKKLTPMLRRNFSSFYVRTGYLLWLSCLLMTAAYAQVNTGGNATTDGHRKQVIGYVTNWDAWKAASAGVPSAGALTHLNLDYSKYTILNYSFFGVASDGSMHSGDLRNKNINQPGSSQPPGDIFFTDIYSSWDLYLLFGELEAIQYISEAVKVRAEAQGFEVEVGGSSWNNPTWGLSGSLPLPLKKEGGAKGLLELGQENGVKVMASIGGWSMSKHFSEMAADPAKKARFIADCKRLIAVGFDGIDLDWEYPGPFEGMNFTGQDADFDNFASLVEDIRAAIGPSKLITAAMSAAPAKLQGFDWPRLQRSMDYFNMMTYDFAGGFSGKANHNAPVYPYADAETPEFNWQSTLNTLNQKGVPSNKINFGIPFYGRGVITDGAAELGKATVKRQDNVQPDGQISTASDFVNWPRDVYDGTPNHFYIKQKALGANSGWTRKWDNEAQVPYLVKDNYFLSYDDEESVGVKAGFINDNNLAGTIIWTAYGDLEIEGSATSFGTKLKRWSSVKSPLVNKINEVFANGGGGGPDPTCTAEGGTITGGPFNFTIDETPDNVTGVALSGQSGANSTWVITDEQGKILGLPPTLADVEAADFNDAGAGVCLIWHLSFDDGLQNAAVGNNASQLEGCFDLSNSIRVTRTNGDPGCTAEGGTIAGGPFDFTIDGTPDNVSGITLTGNSGANSTWVVTDEAGKILGLPATVAALEGVNFDEAGAGVCLIWHLSFEDGLQNAVVGNNASQLEGCFGLSNSLTVTRTDGSGGGDECPNVVSWTASDVYTGGQEAKLDGVRYRAKWWTQGDNPAQNSGASGVWEVTGTCGDDGGTDGGGGDDGNNDGDGEDGCTDITAWSAGNVYTGGQQAKLGGVRYEAKWWTQGNDPSQNSGPDGVWKSLGSCNDDGGDPDPNPDPNPDPDGCVAANGFKVVGYMPSWQGNVSNIQFDKLTHVNYSFLIPNADGSLQPLENLAKMQQLVQQARGTNTKVLIAVGGWLNGNDGAFTALAAQAGTRTAFINNLMSFVDQYGLDGVDMDWEYPREGNEPQDYELLMTELGQRLHSEGKLLTAAVVVSGWNADGVLTGVFDDVDFLNIMAYDGPEHSTIGQATGGLDYWLGRGLPKAKAILGVPFYSRDQAVSYADLLAQGASPNEDLFQGKRYNGIPTIKAKTQLAIERGGGIMIWELSHDTNDPATSLLTAISQVAGDPCGDGGGECQAEGGTLTGGPFEFTIDGEPDNVSGITLSGQSGANSTWVVTDEAGKILGLPPTLADVEAENFDGAGAGVCLIWHLSFENGLANAAVGNNASQLEGCFDLSNSIRVTRTEGDDGGGDGGGDPTLASKILVGYWHNFNNGSTTPRLSEVSRDWDVVNIAFAEPVGGASNMTFTPYEIYNGDVQAFKDDVALLKSRGQKVLISIGGANARVELNNDADREEFITSMTNIINTYGFNGLDIDLEGNSVALQAGDNDYRNPTTPKVRNLIAATKAIRTNIGADQFVLSMAPETAFVQGGYGQYGGIWGAYLPVIHGLRNEMNYIHVQHYNTGSMFGRNGQIWTPATADFHAALMEMLITGFPIAQTGQTFEGLRPDQVAIGLPATQAAAGSGYTPENVVQQAFDYLTKGTSYPGRSYTSAGVYPALRGIMTWSINWDLASGTQFSGSHRPYLDGLKGNAIAQPGVAARTGSPAEVALYPNPVSGDAINLSVSGTIRSEIENLTVRVVNTSGAVVFESPEGTFRSGTSTQSLDISGLGTGLYYYTVTTPSGTTSGKFIKH